MLPRHNRLPVDGYHSVEQEFDPLIVRILRLANHRGYDRDALMSPMLKRLMPVRRPSGDALANSAELRNRLKQAGLDRKAVAYLQESVETELEFARLRLT